MQIVVDTTHDITQLFKMISESIREKDKETQLILENYIIISPANQKIKSLVAESIADFILKNLERKLALEYIKEFELLKAEAEEVLDFIVSDAELLKKRREILKKDIMHLLARGHVNVDGILAFRLENYKQELKFTAEYFVDELSAKKSYEEFIGLMKYFTEIQPPVTDTVVLTENLGEYKLTDLSGNPLNVKFDEEFADELMPIGLTGEDLLISNLMAAMPRKIVFRDVNAEKPIINTISRIFEGRITY